MKKLTALLIAISFVCNTFVSCDKAPQNGEVIENNVVIDGDQNDNDENYQHSQDDVLDLKFNDVIKDYDKEETIDGFTIKGKKYDYEGYDDPDKMAYLAGEILILNIRNDTDTNYKVTLKITYLDTDGNTVKTESQLIDQFPAGYQRYVLFQPKIDFYSYTCDIHTYKYTGETYVDQIFFDFYEFFRFNINPIDLRVKGDFTKYPALCIRTVAHIVPPTPKLYMIYTTILFDTTGKIYVIYTVGGAVEPRSEPGIDSYKEYALLVTRDKNAKVEIPEELIGDISVIFIPVSIEIIE